MNVNTQPTTFNPIPAAQYTQTINAATAKALLQLQCADLQRDPNRNKIKGLSNAMINNTFVASSAILIAIYPDGSKKLADGQHRLLAVLDSDTTISSTI